MDFTLGSGTNSVHLYGRHVCCKVIFILLSQSSSLLWQNKKCLLELVYTLPQAISMSVWLTGTVAGSLWGWGEASFPAKSFIGVVAMERWRPQKFCEEKVCYKNQHTYVLTVHSFNTAALAMAPGLIPRLPQPQLATLHTARDQRN